MLSQDWNANYMAKLRELPFGAYICSRYSVSLGSIFGEIQTDLMISMLHCYRYEPVWPTSVFFHECVIGYCNCCNEFHGPCCLSFSRSIEVYVPPDLLQIGIIITHKKSITTLVWHHGYGEVTTEANSTGTLPTSTVCCPASSFLRHSSCTLRIHVSQFAFVFMASQVRDFHVTFKDTTSFFAHRTSHIALHLSLFTHRSSHIALHIWRLCLTSHSRPAICTAFHVAVMTYTFRGGETNTNYETRGQSVRFELEMRNGIARTKMSSFSALFSEKVPLTKSPVMQATN